MSWWTGAKNYAEKTKLKGDIVLAQRRIESRKKKFGEELYDVLVKKIKPTIGSAISASTLSIFKKSPKDEELKIALENAQNDIRTMEANKAELQTQLDVMEVKGCHTMPDQTIQQKLSKAGKGLVDAGSGTKIRTQMALIDRDIKIRKEQYGLEVYDIAVTLILEKEKKGLKGTFNKALSKTMSEQEKYVQKVIDVAKTDVEVIQGDINSFERRINLIESEKGEQPVSIEAAQP